MYVGHSSSQILYFARSSVGCDSDHCGNKEENESLNITAHYEAAGGCRESVYHCIFKYYA